MIMVIFISTEEQKMLNVAELKKVMRERTNSGGQSGRGSSKRKAPKGAITHLLTLTPQQAAEKEVENTNNNQHFNLPTPVR